MINWIVRRPPHGGRGLKCRSRPAPAPAGCRPPHGGRGLKCLVLLRLLPLTLVVPLTGDVD